MDNFYTSNSLLRLEMFPSTPNVQAINPRHHDQHLTYHTNPSQLERPNHPENSDSLFVNSRLHTPNRFPTSSTSNPNTRSRNTLSPRHLNLDRPLHQDQLTFFQRNPANNAFSVPARRLNQKPRQSIVRSKSFNPHQDETSPNSSPPPVPPRSNHRSLRQRPVGRSGSDSHLVGMMRLNDRNPTVPVHSQTLRSNRSNYIPNRNETMSAFDQSNIDPIPRSSPNRKDMETSGKSVLIMSPPHPITPRNQELRSSEGFDLKNLTLRNQLPEKPYPHTGHDNTVVTVPNGVMSSPGMNNIPSTPLPPGMRASLANSSYLPSRSVASGSFSQRGMISGATLSFHHISYEIKTKKTPCSRAIPKVVLNDVSGILRPGMNAIMGPTGSGKSSLLDVLAGRKDPRFLTGRVLVDGRPQPKNFKCISGYVVQDDIVMGTLTVRENLHFSASLRMTVRCSAEERRQKVDDLLEELGLLGVANSKVGTDLFRGVSGGERKRTNIGMELITEPPVLFLDEPTTGLDAFMAGQVLKTLKTLSRRGRTIIFSIHQPKYSIYKLFDTLTLVCRGQLVYHGPAKYEPIRYFGNLDYVCENHNNPPDFFLDVLHGEAPQRQSDQPNDIHAFNDSYDAQEHMDQVVERLVHAWDESDGAKRIAEEVSAIAERLDGLDFGHKKSKSSTVEVSFSVPFCRQLKMICWRTALNLIRDPLASVVQTLVYLFFAISMGVVYFQMNTSLESGIQNRSGFFFFCTLQVIFVNLGSIELFIKERVIFIHENSSGYYRTSAYFLSKIFCDIVPTKMLPVIVFMPICYWMAGLRADAGAFFFFELILSLTTVAAAGIALFISASVTVFGLANVIVSIIYVFMMVFSGYLINLKSMGAWLSWLRYLSIFRYSLAGLLVMEMKDLTFCPTNNVTNTIDTSSELCEPGTVYLNHQEIPYATAWDLWYNVLGQSLIVIFFYVLCYVQLRRINKYK